MAPLMKHYKAGWNELRGYALCSSILLFGIGIVLWSGLSAAVVFIPPQATGAAALLLLVGITIRPFAGGNEAEWARYLEKLIKSERDQLIAILNSMEEGVTIIGADHTIQFMNPSMVREFGNGVGHDYYQYLFGLEKPCPDITKLANVLKGAIERWECEFPHGRTYDIVASPFTSAEQELCILLAFHNITQRKQYELELVKVNQLKSELLSQKTEQLERISREVDRLEVEKERFVRFLSVVAHDLQSPLAAAQTFLWQILDGFAGEVTDEQRDMLEKSTRRIDRLLRLVGDLLDIPRIETGQIMSEMKAISLNEVIKDSIEELRNLAKKKDMTIELESPPSLSEIYGASARLQQVIENLISNAIKYSKGGTVLIRVAEGKDEIRVEVIDSGIGISPEDLPHLFADFFRGKNALERGTGLGLSISKRIVEAHGGRIWAESPCPETGKGSKFSFALLKGQDFVRSSINNEKH